MASAEMPSADPPEEGVVSGAALDAAPDLLSSPAAGPTALRGSLLLSASFALSVALSLISAPLLIRHLGLATFGRYTTVTALVTIISGLTEGGLLSVSVREWTTRTGVDRQRTMRSLLGIRIELSCVGVLAGVAFAALAGYGSTLVIGTVLAGAGMLLQVTGNLLTVPLQGELRFGLASIVDIARQVITVALIVALVVAGASLLPFLAVTIPGGIATALAAGLLVRRRVSPIPLFRGAQRWALIRQAIPYAAAIALNTLYFRVSIVVMSLIAAARETGIFATSFRVTEVLVGVPGLAVGAAFPILSRAAADDESRFAYAADRILELGLMAGALTLLVLVLSAPFVIAVIAGPQGHPAVSVLQIQGCALLPTFTSVTTGFALLALRRQRALMLTNGCAFLVNLALTLALVPAEQARGAALANVIAESCLALAQLVLLGRWIGVWPRPGTIRALALGLGAGLSPLLIPGIPALGRTAIGVLLFAALLAVQRRIPPELDHVLHRAARND